MQCSVFIAVSVDGFIARPDHGLDWLARVERPGEDYGYAAFADSVDTLVLGRRTHDAVTAFPEWPYAGKRVIVLTRRSLPAQHGEETFAGPVEALVDRLSTDGARRVYLDGGQVIQQALAAGVIDDLTLSVIPVVLGAGIRLFGVAGPERGLVLAGVEAFPSGLVQLRYRLERDVTARRPTAP